jgi:signal transduction histidine kinase
VAALATPRARTVIAISGLLAGAGGGLLLVTSGHLARPLAYGLEVAVIVVATVGIALYWAVRRPGNRLALLLLAYAACAAGLSLQGASSPLLHSIGVLFDAPMFWLGYFVVFAFPRGALAGALEKVLLAAVAWVLLTAFLPWFLFSPVVSGGAPLAGCTASCPSNALMIANKPSIANGFGTTEEYLSVLVGAALVLGVGYRLVSAARPRRRALVPVFVPVLLLAVPFVLFHAAGAGLISLGAEAYDRLGWFLTTGRVLLTFGFLFALWQAMLFAGLALETILSRLGQGDDPGRLRDVVAETLDDPQLELAFEVGRGSGFFVDSAGDPIHVGTVGAGRSATAIERRGDTVAYIVHNAELETDPELVKAAGQAVLLTLENGRLEAELRSRTAELRSSRGRIVAASEAERRKLERDLHDGAQQRLMAIQIKLGLLRDSIDDPRIEADLDEIEDDATAAVDELRSLAHGIYPTVLRERGLADGVRSYARVAPIRVDIVDEGLGRCAPNVEAAVYFCSIEAVQNALKHAGPGACVTVTFARSGKDVRFTIQDDGAGFDPAGASDGVGFVNMRDRIGAAGGELEIVSSPGGGTRIRGTVPDEAAQPVL